MISPLTGREFEFACHSLTPATKRFALSWGRELEFRPWSRKDERVLTLALAVFFL